ncbi:hypothetical protein AAKU61_002931 [Undibacterium sp. GrIS 1.2]|uniref:hypothetical protein n=1 Tax=Undibacterium sp. GrIS 1.2 TaxID=3143933 RepID=UPI00339B8AC0
MIEIAGWSGNPAYVPWLIAQMSDEANGRLAGEAFRLITGFDIEANDAIPGIPNARSSKKQPYPMPDAVKLNTWWQQNHQDFALDTKFFLGRPLSIEWLNHLLGLAEQSHRELAALHRMLIQPGSSRFPTQASSSIQLRHLQKL